VLAILTQRLTGKPTSQGGTPGYSALVGQWSCHQRTRTPSGLSPQTEWKAPRGVEYFADGSFRYFEDGFNECGVYQLVEDSGLLLEETTDSDVKARKGHKTKAQVTLAADHLTVTYEPDSGGNQTEIVYVKGKAE
jgi:hypothetical protein